VRLWFLLGHDEPWSSKDGGDGNGKWAGLRRVLDAAVAARDRGVMTLAAKIGDIDGHVQVGWYVEVYPKTEQWSH